MKIRIFCLIFFLVALAVNAQYQRQVLNNFDPQLALKKLSEDLDLSIEQIEMMEPLLNETKTKLN